MAGTADHRYAALPPQRRAPALRRLAEQHLRSARARRHQRRRPRGSRQQRASQLPAGAARVLRELALRRRCVHVPALRADADLHAHVPALRHPDGSPTGTTGSRTSASSTRPVRSPSTRRSGGAFARISCSRRSRSASATRSPSSARRARSPRSVTRSRHGSRARSTKASRCRRGRTDCSRRTSGARCAGGSRASSSTSSAASRSPPVRGSSSSLEWVQPVADELGTSRGSPFPSGTRPSGRSRATRRAPRWRRSSPSRLGR